MPAEFPDGEFFDLLPMAERVGSMDPLPSPMFNQYQAKSLVMVLYVTKKANPAQRYRVRFLPMYTAIDPENPIGLCLEATDLMQVIQGSFAVMRLGATIQEFKGSAGQSPFVYGWNLPVPPYWLAMLEADTSDVYTAQIYCWIQK